MAQMTGGQALAASLLAQDVAVIFGLPGVQLDWAFDALYAVQDRIRVIHTRHEQATSYMADGYARTTGRPGVCLVVPGPGLLNAASGLATAYACSSPVLCLAGQIATDFIDRGRGVLHEVPRQLELAGSFTKWAARALAPDEVPGLVAEAFAQMASGRPRPVVIELPPDVLAAAEDVSLPVVDKRSARPAGDPDLLEAAAKKLGRAKSPLIFAGGGIHAAEAWEELRELAELLQAPVVMTVNGKGALSARHYLAQNMIAARELMPAADVILAVGTRFALPQVTEWGPNGNQTVIHLDAEPSVNGRRGRRLGIAADARAGLAELVDRVPRHNRKRPSREEELTALKERIDDLLFEIQPQASYAMAIREEIPDDAIVVNESTQVGYWNWVGFPVYEPRTFIAPGYQGTLGYGFATALGAQVGNPDRRVISINGDGGFMFNVQELSTMALHNIPVITIVFNDNSYGNVHAFQKQFFNGRHIATELLNPDFVKLAELFRVEGRRAEGPEGLRVALREALKHDRPVLIEVPVGEMPSPFPLLIRGLKVAPWNWPCE